MAAKDENLQVYSVFGEGKRHVLVGRLRKPNVRPREDETPIKALPYAKMRQAKGRLQIRTEQRERCRRLPQTHVWCIAMRKNAQSLLQGNDKVLLGVQRRRDSTQVLP
jgi:hypothetical protein